MRWFPTSFLFLHFTKRLLLKVAVNTIAQYSCITKMIKNTNLQIVAISTTSISCLYLSLSLLLCLPHPWPLMNARSTHVSHPRHTRHLNTRCTHTYTHTPLASGLAWEPQSLQRAKIKKKLLLNYYRHRSTTGAEL